MLSKQFSITSRPALAHCHWDWLENNRITARCFIIVFCVVIIFYSFVSMVDALCEYSIQRRQMALHTQTLQLEKLVNQVEQLQQTVKEREAALAQTYDRILKREGRLTKQHIVSGNASRLVANDNVLISKSAVSVSRSFSRYSPYHFDVTMPSAITAYELEKIFENTALQGLGKSFITAELRYGINAVFLAALAIHESHWGNSALAQNKNNMFGFAAYDGDPYVHAETFLSKHDCILYVAKFLRDHYINGQYSGGRNISDINRNYASDEDWSHKVFMLMLQVDHDVQEISSV